MKTKPLLFTLFVLNHCSYKNKKTHTQTQTQTQTHRDTHETLGIKTRLSRIYFRMLWQHCNITKQACEILMTLPTILFLKNIFYHGNVHLYIKEYIILIWVTVSFKFNSSIHCGITSALVWNVIVNIDFFATSRWKQWHGVSLWRRKIYWYLNKKKWIRSFL